MINKAHKILLLIASCLFIGLVAHAQTQQPPMMLGRNAPPPKDYKTPAITEYFTPATDAVMTPDAEGFIRRWSLLEPIIKPNRTNTVFVDSYLRENFNTEYFKNQFTIVPRDGQKVKVGKETLKWHSLDSKLFNVKLFRFATGLKKEKYGILFWAVTVINAPEDMEVRMAVGSNSASMWWLNGEEALLMSGDRRMVMDDCTSKRLTLKKGKNILRGAVINGPGMSDFCVRFLDEAGQPVTNLTITTE